MLGNFSQVSLIYNKYALGQKKNMDNLYYVKNKYWSMHLQGTYKLVFFLNY